MAKFTTHSGTDDQPQKTEKARKADPKAVEIKKATIARIRAKMAKEANNNPPAANKSLIRTRTNSVDNPVGLGIKSRDTKDDMDFEPIKYSPKGRKLRKAFERPNPELSANAQDNRIRKVVSITMTPDLLSQVDERCRELDVDRSSFVQAALRQALKPS